MSSNSWSEHDSRRGSQHSAAGPRNDMIEDQLSRMFTEAVGDKLDQMLYKPSSNSNNNNNNNAASSNNTRAGASSANKAPGTLGNGKDFFAELRKQVTSLAEKEKAGG